MSEKCAHPNPELLGGGLHEFDWCPECGAIQGPGPIDENPWRLPEDRGQVMELTGSEIRLLLGLLCDQKHDNYYKIVRKLEDELEQQIERGEDDYAGLAEAAKGLPNVHGDITAQVLEHLRRTPTVIDEDESDDSTTVVKRKAADE